MTRRSLLVVAVGAALLFATLANAQQFQTKAEYDAYMALYNEEDVPTKIALGEAFVAEYPDSEASPIAYQLLVATHYSQRDWRSLLDAAKRFDRAFPDADNDTKMFIYQRAMAAAEQERAPLDTLDFGDKILELDRNNLGALLSLPPVILDNLPEFGSARENILGRAFELANRARVRAQSAYPIAGGDPQQAAQRAQVFSRIHLYLGQVHELRGDDQRAAAEYARILDYDSRNSDAYLRLGLAYHRQAASESDVLQQALENAAARDNPDTEDAEAAPLGEGAAEVDPESAAIEQAVLQNLDLAIDYLSSAAALGGLAADLARTELATLYAMRHEDSLEGLDQLIREKRIAMVERQ